jgi:probable blue pigment (indigoidine) exporter
MRSSIPSASSPDFPLLFLAAGTALTQRWGRPEGVGPLAITGWQLTAGGLFIAPLAFLIEGAPPALDGRAIGGYPC